MSDEKLGMGFPKVQGSRTAERKPQCSLVFKRQFGRNLAAARKAAGMSQKEFAWRIGKAQSGVCYFEHGVRMPSLETVSLMSDVLKMSLDDLIPHVSEDDHDDMLDMMTIYDLLGDDD